MEASVGTVLREARLRKKISLEDAARATKMRPSRIADLENDDYAKFPNLAYSRSFLVLYAKYLGVDISKFHIVEAGSSAGVGDYNYLRNEGGVDTLRFTRNPVQPVKNLRWMRKLVIFLAALSLGLLAGFFVLNIQRLGHVEQLIQKNQNSDREILTAPSLAPDAPSAVQTAPSSEAAPSPGATPASPDDDSAGAADPEANRPSVLPAQPVQSPAPAPGNAGQPKEPMVRRAEPVNAQDAVLGDAPAISGTSIAVPQPPVATTGTAVSTPSPAPRAR